ncbi:hypothetical protein INS49_005423 [Diaporthe citri]|uniref:uncharacterized protein n=1 Tax=Diaporthe citri TaxID=83186 RepID=UPI001C7FD970|nr:uncharacterized protein INS49_005423 [Diaporthe citri]KAG6353714.1 hypothetical protein INS49_005423 [Diaporthe citri]
MSGLEPIAALGLACNILQLAELGKKTIDRIKVVYQGGKPDEELEQGAAVLEELAKELKKHSQPGRKKYEEILLKSATTCATAASDLGEELRFLFENARKGSLVSALKVTTRVAWRQRRLERLRRNLDAEDNGCKQAFWRKCAIDLFQIPYTIYDGHPLPTCSSSSFQSPVYPLGILSFVQNIFSLQLIVSESIRSSTNAAGVEFTGVRRELRFFIEQYRQGRRETTELVAAEGLNTRKHISVEAERINEAVGLVDQKVDRLTALEGAQVDERVRERFLESLKYPGFNQRRNQIDAAYGDTLKWIFVGDNDEESNDDSGSDEYDDSYGDYDSDSNEPGEVDDEMELDQGHNSDEEHISDHNMGDYGQHDSRDAFNTGASDTAGEASWSTVSDSNVTDSEEEENRDHGAFWRIKWDSFSNWLSSTDVIYWISGKPGPGKTTVVKYILADERTKKYLNIWSPGCAIVSHYFWLPGSPMQRNMEGLLSSLLYQLLENDSNASMQIMSSVSGQKSSYTDWSSAELHLAFIRTLGSYENGVCLFLDGIDEIKPEDGTKDGIPEFLDWAIELSQRSKIKLCLASRPDPHILETRLSRYPRLRLQDLNYQDLMAYAKGRVKIPEEAISAEKNDLIQQLADKAEGVFLWLILATKSVNEGFRNEDSVYVLQERVHRLPQGLDGLYKDMWARAGADNPSEYRQTAALYFKMLLASKVAMEEINAFDIMLATTRLADRVLHALADRSKLVREDDMLQQCREVEKKLNIYCVGLIQTVSAVNNAYVSGCSWYGHIYDRIFRVATRTELEFIHRTASDFLTDTKSGREILGFDTSSDFSIQCRLLYARLASLALVPQLLTHASYLAHDLRTTLNRWRHNGRELPLNWNRLVSL